MNKKVLKEFAKQIREEETRNKRIKDKWRRKTCLMISELEKLLVIEVAKKFNPRFNETKFRQECELLENAK